MLTEVSTVVCLNKVEESDCSSIGTCNFCSPSNSSLRLRKSNSVVGISEPEPKYTDCLTFEGYIIFGSCIVISILGHNVSSDKYFVSCNVFAVNQVLANLSKYGIITQFQKTQSFLLHTIL